MLNEKDHTKQKYDPFVLLFSMNDKTAMSSPTTACRA